jgi:hypothetical protein
MADRTGFIVPFTVVTSSTVDQYPVALANDIKGGLHSADTPSDRDMIFADRKQDGMLCYVRSEKKTYQLIEGVWEEMSFGEEPVVHTQKTAADTWTINHGLKRYPEVEVRLVDTWVNCTVHHPDKEQTVLKFAFPAKGIAQLT